MNKKTTVLFTALAIALGAVFSLTAPNKKAKYKPRVYKQDPTGGIAYFNSMRNNEITGTIDPADYNAGYKAAMKMHNDKTKAEWPIRWEFGGPDNIGGRARDILIDQQNPNVLYTASTSGSIYKSINKGASWYPLSMDNNGFGVVCLTQTDDNAIYAGTGENFIGSGIGGTPGEESSVYIGNGIYKSTDGENFTLLTNTGNFGNVGSLASYGNTILAGTQLGLRYSTDGGANWSLLRSGSCKDVVISKNGVVLCNIGSALFRSTDITNAGSYSIVPGISSNTRMAAAWSESDPNYCYVITAGNVDLGKDGTIDITSALTGLWRSKDAGANWEEVLDQESTFFSPFSSGSRGQAFWDFCLGVHPRDRDRVFMGGIEFAEWSASKGPEIVGQTGRYSGNNPFVIHSDKHRIRFDNSGEFPIMYVCSDGGVVMTTDSTLRRYADRSINLTTTQYYAVAANPAGEIIGSTQDNGNILVETEAFPRKPGGDILQLAGLFSGADGFNCAMSQYNSDVMFAMAQEAALGRSVDGGKNTLVIWDNRVRTSFNGTWPNDGAGFSAGLHLWENQDAIEGKALNGPSEFYDSIYDSRLFLWLTNGVWMCNNAAGSVHNGESPSNDNIRWFRLTSNIGKVNHMATTRDGNSLFAATGNGRVYRIDGINKANWDTTELVQHTAISDSLSQNNITSNLGIGSRHITDISVDPTDDNRVLVTVGNYGSNTYVFITENALDPSPNWRSITTNLPRVPVYSGIISADDPSILIIGTEYGMYATDNGYSNSPTWVVANTGVDAAVPFPTVPVLDLTQSAEKPWTGHKIVAGTHGAGMWSTGSLLTSLEPQKETALKFELTAYPNPANQSINLKSGIKGEYTLRVYDLNGREVLSNSGRSNGNIQLNTSSLRNGSYFVEVIGLNAKAVTKMIVQH